MEKRKDFLPQTFEVINGITYFRLEDGKVAVEKPTKVIIDSKLTDNVKLVTLKFRENTVMFWRINNEIHALASTLYSIIPRDAVFKDIYFSENYSEGFYVKYKNSTSCGILYISETEVSSVISHEKTYSDISFENGIFYAETIDENQKKEYSLINESSQLLGTFPTKCKKLDGYLLFYDNNKIITDSKELEVADIINSLEVIIKNKVTLVRVITNSAIYYYTNQLEYIAGPLKNESVIQITDESCYIIEECDNKIVQLIYIGVEFSNNNKGDYNCKTITSSNNIIIYNKTDITKQFFVSSDNTLYSFPNKFNTEFKPILQNIQVDEFSFIRKFGVNVWNILGLKDKLPAYFAIYNHVSGNLQFEGALEMLDDGFEEQTKICKSNDKILVIKNDGTVIVNAKGSKCYKKRVARDFSYEDIYVVDDDMNSIQIFSKTGKKYL